MRNIDSHLIHGFLWICIGVMVYMIFGVMSQPMAYGAEPKKEFLKPGYIPQPTKAPQIDSKPISPVKGYLYNPKTGTTQYIELRSYQNGNQTFYEGEVGRNPEIRDSFQKIDEGGS